MDYPHIVGAEGTGRIAELGEVVESWQVGDRVAWHESPGSYATQVVINTDDLLRVPEGREHQGGWRHADAGPDRSVTGDELT